MQRKQVTTTKNCLAYRINNATDIMGKESILFREKFKNIPGVTTSTEEWGEWFDGTVFINKREFVCLNRLSLDCWMVYINNPYEDGKQWVFGEYKTFAGALRKTAAIMAKREYPKPVLVW